MKSIKELSKEYQVSSRTIRYYEEIFHLNSVKKARVRYYDSEKEGKIKRIIVLRKLNFSLNQIKEMLFDLEKEKVLKIISDEKKKCLAEIKTLTNTIILLNEFKTLISTTTDDLDEFISSDLFDTYRSGKEEHMHQRIKKQSKIIHTLFDMIQSKDILPFQKYCHSKMELIGFQDFLFHTLKLNETLLDYKIYAEYSLYNGSVFVVVNTINEEFKLKIVFNTDDIVVGIWIVELNKHND